MPARIPVHMFPAETPLRALAPSFRIVCGSIALAALILALAGCGRSGAQTVVVTGSSTLAPLVMELAEREERAGEARIDVHSGGTGRGLEDVRRGTADLGMVSRALRPDESDLHAYPIGRDGVAVIVNAANPVTELGASQLEALYRGEVQHWSEIVDFESRAVVIHKAAGRATQAVFLEHLGLSDEAVEARMIAGENQEVIRLVAGNRGAIGYVSIGPALEAASGETPIRLLALDGVPASVEEVQSGRYPLTRELTLVSREPAEGAAAALIERARSAEASEIHARYGFVQPAP